MFGFCFTSVKVHGPGSLWVVENDDSIPSHRDTEKYP